MYDLQSVGMDFTSTPSPHSYVQLVVSNYYATGTAALLIWYSVTTLDKEVEYFWRCKISAASLLFLANQYLALIDSIHAVPWWGSPSSYEGCMTRGYTGAVLDLSRYVVWAAFSSLRAYALWRKWPVAALVFVLCMGPFIIGLYELRFQVVEMFRIGTTLDCVPVNTPPIELIRILNIVIHVSLLAGDAIVLIVTWAETYRYQNERGILGFGRMTTLASVLYQNSAIYFVALTAMNLLHMVLCLLASTPGGMAAFLADLTYTTYTTASTILISHFLIRLQEASNASRLGDVSSDGDSWRMPRSSGSVPDILQFARADVDTWARELRSGGRSSAIARDEDDGAYGQNEASEYSVTVGVPSRASA